MSGHARRAATASARAAVQKFKDLSQGQAKLEAYRANFDKRMDYIARNPNYRQWFPENHPMVLYRTFIDTPKNVYLDPTGSLMITTTADSLETMPQALQNAYHKLQQKIAGLTKALTDKKKRLFDFEAWSDAIGGTGEFTPTDLQDQTFNSSSIGIKLHLVIIADVVKAIVGAADPVDVFGSVAEKIITGVAEKLEINIESKDMSKKVGHMLIILEDVFGMANV